VRAVVVVPTFNERENIADLLRALRSTVPAAHVMVIDDLSPDGTGEAADAVATELGQITVVHRSGKPGLGAAYRHGFNMAFEQGFDVVVSMDSDFSHDPAVIPTMLRLLEEGRMSSSAAATSPAAARRTGRCAVACCPSGATATPASCSGRRSATAPPGSAPIGPPRCGPSTRQSPAQRGTRS
jgi:glycosyltransferase involved in cell wall biosynthesis